MVVSLVSMVWDFQFQLLLYDYLCSICLAVNKLIIILSTLSFSFVFFFFFFSFFMLEVYNILDEKYDIIF